MTKTINDVYMQLFRRLKEGGDPMPQLTAREITAYACKACLLYTSMAHDGIHAVRNVNLNLSSGNRALINPQAVIKVVGNAGCIRAAHLTLTSQRIQDFVFRMGVEHTFEVD